MWMQSGYSNTLLITILASLLSACGGSGGGSSQSTSQLQVDLGAARLVVLPETLTGQSSVTLDGQSTSQVDYQWRQTGGPGTVQFSDSTSASPTITFPLNGSYQLALDVTHDGLSASDSLEVTVNTLAAGASGLSSSPANTTQCVASADAPVASTIALSTPFPNLPSLAPLVALYQAPGDNTTWYAVKQNGEVVSFEGEKP